MSVSTISPGDTQPDDGPGTDLAMMRGRPNLGALTEWAEALSATARGVEQIVDTPFIPASYWPLPKGMQLKDYPNPALRHPHETDQEYAWRRQVAIASTTTAINVGSELGLGPNAAMKYLYVYRGRPAMYAEGMLALLHMRGHSHRKMERSDTRAAVAIRLRGRQDWVEYEFTIEQATQAKYLEQNAKYKTDPWSMLWARAVSIAIRSECPEILGGLDGEADVVDVVESEAVDVTARVTIEDLAARLGGGTAPAGDVAVARAAVEAAATREAAGDSAVPMMDQATWNALQREWKRLGVVGQGSQERRTRGLLNLIGRPVEGPNEITQVEAITALDTLRSIRGESPDDGDTLLAILGETAPVPDENGDAGDVDVPEPTDEERAAAAAAEQQAAGEPKGWEK